MIEDSHPTHGHGNMRVIWWLNDDGWFLGHQPSKTWMARLCHILFQNPKAAIDLELKRQKKRTVRHVFSHIWMWPTRNSRVRQYIWDSQKWSVKGIHKSCWCCWLQFRDLTKASHIDVDPKTTKRTAVASSESELFHCLFLGYKNWWVVPVPPRIWTWL